MSESIRQRNTISERQVRARSWSDISDIMDDELDSYCCRWFQGIFAISICFICGVYIKTLKLF